MGLTNFSKNDLTADKLPILVQDLRRAVSNKEYRTVEEFAKAFATAIESSVIGVDHTDGEKRVVDVNGEKVDLSKTVSEIMQEIDKSRSILETDPAKVAEYAQMYDAVDKQLTALFMQDKMMEELVSRDFSREDYTEQILSANVRSDEKIKVYTDQIKKFEKIRDDALEYREEPDTNGNIRRVSLKTQLKDEKDAVIYLDGLSKDMTKIKALEDAIATMETEISADASKEAMYRGKIDANKAEVENLTTDVKGKVESLKDLRLVGFDYNSIKDCDDKTKLTRDNALTAIGTLQRGMNARILDVYKKIEENLETKTTGLFMPSELYEMADIKSTDPAKVETAKQAIDKAVEKIEKSISDNTKFKAQEEALKIARVKTLDEYTQMADRKQELSSKFEKVQAVDDDGHPIYLDANGHDTLTPTARKKYEQVHIHDENGRALYVTSSGTITHAKDDGAGHDNKPYMSDLLLTQDAEEEYLREAGFDRTARESSIRSSKETALKTLSWRERRSLLKAQGIGNPITRFFNSQNLMNSVMDELVDAESASELQSLEDEAGAILSKKHYQQLRELSQANSTVRQTEETYRAVRTAAAIQREIANGVYENTDVLRSRNLNDEANKAIDAMQDAALEQTSLIMAEGILGGRDLTKFREAMERYTYRQVTREHNEKSGITDKAQNPQHEDLTR